MKIIPTFFLKAIVLPVRRFLENDEMYEKRLNAKLSQMKEELHTLGKDGYGDVGVEFCDSLQTYILRATKIELPDELKELKEVVSGDPVSRIGNAINVITKSVKAGIPELLDHISYVENGNKALPLEEVTKQAVTRFCKNRSVHQINECQEAVASWADGHKKDCNDPNCALDKRLVPCIKHLKTAAAEKLQ